MQDAKKTKKELIGELSQLRRRVAELESAKAARGSATKTPTSELLDTVFESTHVLMAYLDPQFNFVRVNRAYAEADERDSTFFPGKNHFDLYPNEENEAIFRRVVETGKPHFAHAKPFMYAEHPERGVSSWDWSLVPVKDSHGAATGLVLSIVNATERKRVEDALRESEAKFRGLAETSPAGILIHRGANYYYVNKIFEEMTGYSRPELLAMPFWEVVHPDFRDLVRNRGLTRQNGETPPSHYEFKIVKKGGEERWADLHATRIEFEGQPAVLATAFDVTERKQAEDALRDALEFNRQIVTTAQDGILVCDRQFRFRCWNPYMETVSGLREEEVLGKHPLELFPFLREQGIYPLLERAMAGESISTPDHEFHVPATGKTGWAQNEFTPLRDARGEIIGVLGTVHDITERKRAEEVLRNSEALYHSLVETLPQFIFRKDLEGRFTFASERFCEFLGKPKMEVLGKTDFDFYPPELAEKYQKDNRHVVEGCQLFETVEEHQIPGGERIHVQVTKTAVYDAAGRVVGVQGIFWDITDRKRADEALRASERLLTDTFESIQDGISVLDRDLTVRRVNGVIERWYAANLPLVGRKCHLCYHNSDTPCDPCPTLRCLQSGQTECEIVPGLPGSPVEWLELYSYPIKDPESGEVKGVVEFVRDITARKRADEERRQLEEQVRRTQKLESLGVLAGGIAHDFNNLLLAILGNAELALVGLSPVAPVRPLIQDIAQAAMRAADLTRQMLAYSGKGRFVIQGVDLSEVVKEMSHLLRSSISKKVHLALNLASDLPSVEADVAQIQQVVMNLITNASEAIGDDNGDLRVRTGSMECDSVYLARTSLYENQPEGTYVFLEVSDTGCGMDEETQKKMFDPFFTTKFTGRGLGMAAVLGIVRGHKGAIKVDSRPGRGTTIRVLFPASKRGAEALDRTVEKAEPYRGSGTILVVDDEDVVRQLCKRILEESGFTVLTARNGREAVETYRQRADQIVCVLLDMTMPEMDGRETLHELRRVREDVRVILSSGYSEQEIARQFPDLGVVAFIEKPYGVGNLIGKLRAVLEQVAK